MDLNAATNFIATHNVKESTCACLSCQKDNLLVEAVAEVTALRKMHEQTILRLEAAQVAVTNQKTSGRK